MILKSLADYYRRLLYDPATEIAPLGFEMKPIDFIVVIDTDGNFVNLRDAREDSGRKRRGRPTLVPKGVKRSANIAANLLWDTPSYALGVALPEKKKDFEKLVARAVKQHAAFVEKIEQTFYGYHDLGIQALLVFLKSADFEPLFKGKIWTEVAESGGNISFMLSEDTQLICQRKDVDLNPEVS